MPWRNAPLPPSNVPAPEANLNTPLLDLQHGCLVFSSQQAAPSPSSSSGGSSFVERPGLRAGLLGPRRGRSSSYTDGWWIFHSLGDFGI